MRLTQAQQRALQPLAEAQERDCVDAFYWHEADRSGGDSGRVRLQVDDVTRPGFVRDSTIYRLRDAGYVVQQGGVYRITGMGREALERHAHGE